MIPQCNKCNKKNAVYHRRYSGEILCKSCFLNSIEKKTLQTISKYSMLRFNQKIAVGVSGGKDSLTLLHILKKISKRNNNEIIAITIDEGIEGYRNESLSLVKNFCNEKEVSLRIFSYKELFGSSMDDAIMERKSNKSSSCSICGTFRRRALDIASQSVNAEVLATAHNLDDYLQTFMINLFSGDVGRIGWMYPQPIEYNNGLKKIKPFVELYESEIVFYAFHSGIEFQIDQCPYMNESIRSEFRLFFNDLEKIHPGIKYNCFNSMNKMSKIVKSTEKIEPVKNTCLNCGETSSNSICSVCTTIQMLDFNKKNFSN
ncbi:TIGR00269 family protein [Candidatus Nitrosocosmicus hydrocola]|uniref:TIGR00269 family protein n=1 Tax=Candidatus Nitrosocosmicus hydrocola TaxID=1826872 RepID=UPI000B1EF70C|nr:TIGR00269 family protein [Candidatus Nitrosocosmicus hydrocola]